PSRTMPQSPIYMLLRSPSTLATTAHLPAPHSFPTRRSSDLGQIFIGGKDITKRPEYKRQRRIGRVYQNPAMGTCPSMTILENMSDRKSTRLNSSHVSISYAVFSLKHKYMRVGGLGRR